MCNCFPDVNAKLAESGGELLADFFTDPPRAFISTYRRKGRKKLPLVQASFCPFCGTKYPPNRNAIAKASMRPPGSAAERSEAISTSPLPEGNT